LEAAEKKTTEACLNFEKTIVLDQYYYKAYMKLADLYNQYDTK
jgi:hypothetical protein